MKSVFRVSIMGLKKNKFLSRVWSKPKEFDFFLQKTFGLNASEYYKNMLEAKKLDVSFKLLSKLIFGSFLKKMDYPLEYIFKEAEFLDEVFIVNKNVLIPRVETEELVELIRRENLSFIEGKKTKNILDLGTGSGVIAISLKKIFPQAQVYGLDISKKAINLARENANSILDSKAGIFFYNKNIFHCSTNNFLRSIKFDLIVSNPPYVAKKEKKLMSQVTLKHEPKVALFAGKDGLDFYRRLSPLLSGWLNHRGRVYWEMGFQQAVAVREIFSWLKGRRILKDMAGKDRFFYGEK